MPRILEEFALTGEWPGLTSSNGEECGYTPAVSARVANCVKKGFHWDEAILYPPHARWGDWPEPLFWNGPVPVYRIADSLDKTLSEQP